MPNPHDGRAAVLACSYPLAIMGQAQRLDIIGVAHLAVSVLLASLLLPAAHLLTLVSFLGRAFLVRFLTTAKNSLRPTLLI